MTAYPDYPSAEREINLEQYLFLLWDYLWLLILVSLLATGAAFAISQFITPVYEASTTLLIDEAASSDATEYNSLLASERRARTYAQLLTEQPILEATIANLGLDISTETLAGMVQARRVPDTQLIEIVAESTDPDDAARIANTVVDVFIEQNQTLQTSRYAASKESLSAQLGQLDQQIEQTTEDIAALGTGSADLAERDRLEALLAQYQQTYASLLQSYEEVRIAEAQSSSNVIQIKAATVPTQPVRPNMLLNTLLGTVVGFGLAVSLVFMRELLNDTIKTPDEFSRSFNLPVLAVVPSIDTSESQLVTLTHPRSSVAEAFRSLRTNIQYASVDRPLKTILITSPMPKDGKSTVSSNLGVVNAQNGRQVILIDSDLRKPTIHHIFRLANDIGISDMFVTAYDKLSRFLKRTEVPGLLTLTSGNLPPNPSELLDSRRARHILDTISSQAEMVLIDTPPVVGMADAAILAPHVDGVLLVIKLGQTTMPAVRQAVMQLDQVGANLIGVVLNGLESRKQIYSRYSYYYYGYGYHSQDKASESPATGPRIGVPNPIAGLGRAAKGSSPAAAVGSNGGASHPAPSFDPAVPGKPTHPRLSPVGDPFMMDKRGSMIKDYMAVAEEEVDQFEEENSYQIPFAAPGKKRPVTPLPSELELEGPARDYYGPVTAPRSVAQPYPAAAPLPQPVGGRTAQAAHPSRSHTSRSKSRQSDPIVMMGWLGIASVGMLLAFGGIGIGLLGRGSIFLRLGAGFSVLVTGLGLILSVAGRIANHLLMRIGLLVSGISSLLAGLVIILGGLLPSTSGGVISGLWLVLLGIPLLFVGVLLLTVSLKWLRSNF